MGMEWANRERSSRLPSGHNRRKEKEEYMSLFLLHVDVF